MSFIVIILLVCLLWLGYVGNRIPKTGRFSSAKGEKITATITNCNKFSDKAVTLRAQKDDRKFKVKLKPTEAHLWIKGDSIDILLGSKTKEYRVLFNDYFRNNEPRIREEALRMLEKVDGYLLSSKFVNYAKEHFEMFKDSHFDSQRIFSFITYMKLIDISTVAAAVLGAGVLLWWKIFSPDTIDLIAALVLVFLVVWAIYNTVTICKRTLKELSKTKKTEE